MHRVILLAKVNTYRAQPFEQAAERLGIDIVKGVDMPPHLVDYWQVPLGMPFSNIEQAVETIVQFANHTPVHAILAIDDSAATIAAQASSRLGLPHNDVEAAIAARNKYCMRQMLAAAEVASPAFWLHTINEDSAALAHTVPYPCVVKPLYLSGSRGVIRANNPAEFVAAFERLARLLRCKTDSTEFLVEAYIPGVEVALEGMLDQGQLHVLALFDKPDPLEGPFFEETIYVTPSRLPESVQAEIVACATQAAAALGLQHGPVHAELRINEHGPWIVEVAARSIGGLCSKTLRFGPDMSLEALILQQAVGLPLDSLQRERRASGVMMIPIPEAGVLKKITGLAEAEAVPGIESVEMTVELHQPLTPLPEGESYLGFIFAKGDTPAQVEAALRQSHQHLGFEVMPLLLLV